MRGYISLDSSTWSSDMEQPKKKRTRARLDHMSQEEKQERRKEKNRQAAQAARDRKRYRQESLEVENRRLREENMKLRLAILGSGQQQLIQSSQNAQNPLPLLNPITDSGISDIGSSNSSNNYSASTISLAPSDEQMINSMMEGDNDISLVDEVQKLVSYVNADSAEENSFESAALINAPLPQVKDATSTESTSTAVNSLGWTSVQLMLILLISRIHHRSSAKINCCLREHAKSLNQDEVDPINCNLYDYILHTKCMDFRRAAEAIISNKNRVRQQRLIALDFVHKYSCPQSMPLQDTV